VRHLAWLLLLANVGMFVWIFTQPEPQVPQYRPIPVPPGVEPLVLLSERTVKTGAVPDAGTHEQHTAPTVQTAQSPPDRAGEADSAAGGGAAGTDGSAGDQSVGRGEVTPDAGEEARQVSSCQTVGPLLERGDATTLAAQLAAQGYASHMRTGEVRNPSGYWVYMPAMPAAEAHRIVAELDAHGLSDYYIGKQNYISLGIFSRKDKAQRHLDEIRKLGFDAVLDRRYRTRDVYWLDVEQGTMPLLASEVWAQIRKQQPDIRVQRVSCE
jgi:hypothetical protein